MTVPPELRFMQWLIDQGYQNVKPISGGRWAGIQKKAFTHSIEMGRIFDMMNVDDSFCYSDYEKAKSALDSWNGEGEPTGWHRHPSTGRRVSQSPDERDEKGKIVGAVGVPYILR